MKNLIKTIMLWIIATLPIFLSFAWFFDKTSTTTMEHEECVLLKNQQVYNIEFGSTGTNLNYYDVVNLEQINDTTAVGELVSNNTLKPTHKIEINYKDGLYQMNIYGTENENGEIINQDVITKSIKSNAITIQLKDSQDVYNMCEKKLRNNQSDFVEYLETMLVTLVLLTLSFFWFICVLSPPMEGVENGCK